MFIRVRGASPGDPLHEFDIPLSLYERRKHLYKVVDRKPVAKARPASHIPGLVPARKSAFKPGEDSEAPSVGRKPKEKK